MIGRVRIRAEWLMGGREKKQKKDWLTVPLKSLGGSSKHSVSQFKITTRIPFLIRTYKHRKNRNKIRIQTLKRSK
jgi:hypothetical protein